MTGKEDDPLISDIAINAFLEDFAGEIVDGTAAVFAGAGLSVSAGHVNWQNLLAPVASELGLNVEREHDLVALAQWHCNERSGNRNKLSQILVTKFCKLVEPTINHEILCRLPINTFWTTNYDKILETCLERAGRAVDVKKHPEEVTLDLPMRSAILYKMHGDMSNPAKTILTKDEYTRYSREYKPFVHALMNDLASKTFLFIGFSFTDPNLETILSTIRAIYGDNSRTHYAFFKWDSLTECKENEEEHAYRLRKQKLIINDLIRFGVHPIMVKEYSDITLLLKQLEEKVNGKEYKATSIYISGCAYPCDELDLNDVDDFLSRLAFSLLEMEYRILSDRSVGVGINILASVAQYLSFAQRKDLSRFIMSTPPRLPISSDDQSAYSRETLINRAKAAIFVFGNFQGNSESGIVPSMKRDFEVAKQAGTILIPIGATGYSARLLWEVVVKDFDNFFKEATHELYPLI